MKKIFILSSILIVSVFLPSFAMCPVDEGAPEARLTPLNRSDIRNEANSFAPSENNFNYNSSCQFGVCLQNRDTPLFQKAQ